MATRTWEDWREIPGWPQYEVSSIGRVRSRDRVIEDSLGRSRRQRGVLKRTWVDNGGYRRVELSRDNARFGAGVHRLVALAFIGNPEPEQETRHLDGDSLNNCVENLAWGSHSENMQDVIKHGRYVHRNAIKTHCKCGGEFTGVNSRGERICHPCISRRQRQYRVRREDRERAE